MTIATTTNSVTANGNGSTTVFAYAFYIPDAASVIVTYTDADGVATQLLPSQFSISGLGDAAGGSVTYPLAGSPIATGTKLTITRIVPYTQPTALTSQGPYLPGAVEAALDNLEMQIQQLAASITSGVAGVSSFNSRTGAISLASIDVTSALGFTPLDPANNLSELASAVTARTNLGLGTMAVEAAADYAKLASPTFTGTPAAPTAADGTNTTQIATTAFVQSAIAGSVAGVSSFNTRTGSVTLSSADVTAALTYTPLNVAQNLADLASIATARSNLGLDSMALEPVTKFYRHLAGLEPDKFSTNVLTINPGSCVSANSTKIYATSTELTIDLTTTGAGGLDTGTVTNGQMYYIYLIADSSTDALAGIASTSITYGGVTMPAGYDMVRKLPFGFPYDSGKWDGIPDFHLTHSPQPFVRFTQAEEATAWRALSVAAGAGATTWTDVDLSPWVPDNARQAYLMFRVGQPASGVGYAQVRSESSQTAGITVGYGAASSAMPFVYSFLFLRVTSTRHIQYQMSSTNAPAFAIFVLGYDMTEPV